MSDFIARVVAELDTSKVESQLNALAGKKYKLQFDTADISLFTKNIKTEMGKIGNNAGLSFSKNLYQSLSSADASRQFKSLNNSIAQTQKNLNNVNADSLNNVVGAVTKYFSSYRLVANGLQELKDGFKFVNELDDAITNISYTMDVSTDQLKDFSIQAVQMAQDLHTSAKTVLEASTLYANANETISSITEKTKTAVMLSNVTGMSGGQSAKTLQSIINQFDLSKNDLLMVSDTLQSISQSMAYDFSGGIQQIANGISTSGSVAKDAGLSLAEYSAMLGTIIEQTGNGGSQVGNALKTIFTRITKVSKTAGTLTEDISAAEASLRSVGIEVRSSSGEFREVDDIIGDLAKKCESLSDVELSNLSFNLAGTRQINIIKSLLKSWDLYEERVENATNLENSPTLENQKKYAESMTGHLEELTAAAESFWATFIDTKSAKSAVDLLTNIINVLEGLINTLGGFGTIGAGVALFSLLKNRNYFGTLISSLAESEKSLSDFGAAASMAGTDLKNFLKTPMGVATAVGTVTAVIGLAVQAYQNYQQELKKTREAQLEQAQAAVDNANAFEDVYIISSQYANKTNLTADEESKFKTAVESASEALSGKAGAFDTATGSARTYLDTLQKVEKEQLKQAKIDATKERDVAEKLLQSDSHGWMGSKVTVDLSGRTGVEEFVQAKEVLESLMGDYIDLGTYGEELEPINWDKDNTNMDALVDYYYQLINLQDQLADKNLTNNDIYDDSTKIINNLKDDVSAYVKAKYDELKFSYEAKNGIPKTMEEYNKMHDAILRSINASQKYKDILSGMMKEDFSDYYDEWKNKFIESSNETTENIFKATEEQKKEVESSFKDSSVKDWFGNLSEDKKNFVYQIGIESDDTALWTLDKWKEELQYLEENNETAAKSMQKFYDIMNDTGDNNFSEEIESRTKKLDTLKDALEKLQSGNLSNSDTVELFKQFPELIEYSDDLETGISKSMQKIIGSSEDATSIIGIFDNQIEKLGKNSAGANAIKKLRDEIIRLYDTTSDGNENFLESITSKYSEQIDGLSSQMESVQNDIDISKLEENYNVESFYDELIQLAQQKRQLLILEKSDLENVLSSGSINKDSTEYKEIQEQIKSIDSQIRQADKSVVQYKKDIKDLQTQKFDKIKQEFSDQASLLDHEANMLNKQIEAIEKRGDVVDASQYETLIALEQQRISKLEQQLASLQQAMQNALSSGAIQEGDHEWYEMQKSINDTEESIIDAKNAIIDYNQAIKQIEIDKFDKIVEKFDGMTSALDHQTNMLDKQIQLIEARGNDLDASMYENMINIEQQRISMLQSKMAQLQSAMQSALSSGAITQNDAEFNKMQSEIYSCEEAILDAQIAIEKFNQSIKDLYIKRFDDIADRFEGEVDFLEHRTTTLNNQLKMIELQNSWDSPQMYEDLIDNEYRKISMLSSELSSLQSALNEALSSGAVRYGTTEFYRMQNQIYGVEEAIQQANLAILEFQESLKQSYVDQFDHLVDVFDYLREGTDYQIKRIENKIKLSELRGGSATFSQYKQMQDYERSKINSYTSELSQLAAKRNEAVRSGAIAVYSDEWYKMENTMNDLRLEIQQSEIAIEELNQSIQQSYVDKFNDISDKFDYQMKVLNHKATTIENDIQTLETKGEIARVSQYEKLIDIEESKTKKLLKERSELENAMMQAMENGVKKNTDEWYNMQTALLDIDEALQQVELDTLKFKESIKQLFVDAFKKVESEFNLTLSSIEHDINYVNGSMDLLETQGYISSKTQHKELIYSNDEKRNQLIKERSELEKAYNKALKNGIEISSDDALQMRESIWKLDEEIQNTTTELVKLGNELREIEWERLDWLTAKISTLSQESDFLISLLEQKDLYNEQGQATYNGKAVLGLHAVNYDTYMSQADLYAEQRRELEKLLKDDPYNTNLQDKYEEYAQLQQQAIKNAMSEKEAMKDLAQEGVGALLDSLSELIDKRKEALKSEKDLYDYQKSIEKKVENIASLEKQLNTYANDDSEENLSRLQQLKTSLEEAREDLEETEYEKYISDQEKLLDDLYTEYEDLLNERLDNVDFLLQEIIDSTNANSDDISKTIEEATSSVGYELTNEMKNIWNSGNPDNVVAVYGEKFAAEFTTVNSTLDGIKRLLNRMIKNSDGEKAAPDLPNTNQKPSTPTINTATDGEISSITPTIPPVTSTDTTIPPSKDNNNNNGDGIAKVGDKVIYDNGIYYYSPDGYSPIGSKYKGKKVYITKIDNASWATKPYHISTGSKLGDGDLGWVELSQLKGYAKGAKSISKNQLAITQEEGAEIIISPSTGAILTPLKKGDSVLTKDMTKTLWDLAKDPNHFIRHNFNPVNEPSNLNLVNTSNNNNVKLGDTVINVNIDHVQDYNDFAQKMMRDDKIVKYIQAVTIDPLAGKSLMRKNRFIN